MNYKLPAFIVVLIAFIASCSNKINDAALIGYWEGELEGSHSWCAHYKNDGQVKVVTWRAPVGAEPASKKSKATIKKGVWEVGKGDRIALYTVDVNPLEPNDFELPDKARLRPILFVVTKITENVLEYTDLYSGTKYSNRRVNSCGF